MTDKVTTLAGKIAAASRDVGGSLKADKKNLEQRYDYISADKILTICGRAIAAQGLVIFPAIVHQELVSTPRKEKNDRLDMQVDFMFTISDGETSLELPWTGRGTDYTTPDKALYKAITSGHKYFLMKLLNVGEGNEDSEHEADDDKQAAPAQPAPVLTLVEAKAIKNSKGSAYGEIDSEVLSHMSGSIDKALKQNHLTAETRLEHLRKLEAIRMILADQAQAQPAEVPFDN